MDNIKTNELYFETKPGESITIAPYVESWDDTYAFYIKADVINNRSDKTFGIGSVSTVEEEEPQITICEFKDRPEARLTFDFETEYVRADIQIVVSFDYVTGYLTWIDKKACAS